MKQIYIIFTNPKSTYSNYGDNVVKLISQKYLFYYDRNTKVQELFEKFWGIIGEEYRDDLEHFYLKSDCKYRAIRSDYPLAKLLANFSIHETMNFFYKEYFGEGGVEQTIGEKLGVKFFYHSDEGCHLYSPHIHVQDLSQKKNVESISLVEPIKVLTGSISSKKEKKVIKYISEHKDRFLEYWYKYTNGLKVPEV